MANSRVYRQSSERMAKPLDIYGRQHKMVAGNTVDTGVIGYKPRGLDFNRHLQQAMAAMRPDFTEKLHARHLPADEHTYITINDENSGNADIYHSDSAVIDGEMMNLMKNNMNYRTTIEMLIRKMKRLQHTIEEGGI